MRTRLTHILAFLLPALLALYLGLQAHARALVDLDTVAAMGNAWRVFHWQETANMALIGFDQPPLMALLFVPFGAFAPKLLVSGLAAPVLGAVFLGLSALIIWRLSRSLGLPAWLAAILGAVFTLHPLVLSYAMLGSRGIVLTFVLLGLAASLVSWQREGPNTGGRIAGIRPTRVRDVLTAGFFAAAAILLAYETVVLVVAAALYLAACCRGEKERPPAKAEGLLIAFLLPAAYVALVWIGANWAIMGDPWHFWPRGIAPLRGDFSGALSAAIAVAMAASPLLLALLYHGLRRRLAGFAAPAAWIIVASFLGVLLFPETTDRYLWPQSEAVAASALGAGWALLVALLAQLRTAERGRSLRAILSPGLLIIACGSLYLAYAQQTQEHVLPVGLRTVLRGHPAFATPVADDWAAGDRLRGAFTPHLNHVIAGPTAYVVALRAETRQDVIVATSYAKQFAQHHDIGLGSMVVVFRGEPTSPPSGIVDRFGGQPGPGDIWQRLKPELRLELRWRQGPWTCYQFAAP